ncbi:NF038129 family PEP-CTERM protein [Massilia rubra]|uniref:PEP-CTERM sorting domain-containing protein n=1 Tax=Massilia rubra TaxID=2607910 RepID=A0ABX0LSL3_9BURK|nr:NF038129 family PEP-CTERM protein [Massilia rubra]NHZ37437.1 PEP-CTERM sorting domain-containing protein [Massilia rubra]
MFDIKRIITKALLAVTFALGASTAWAIPTYHVNIDSSQFVGKGGAMLLSFNSKQAATSAFADVSNFGGIFEYELSRSGAVTGAIPGMVNFANSGNLNYLMHKVTLGGMLSFDVTFHGDFETIPGSFGALFGVALVDLDTGDYHGAENNLIEFDLNPPSDDGGTPTIKIDNPTRIVTVTTNAVPEPSDLLLVMTGLGLVAFVRRRTSKATR